jgi:hypothetical protein
MTCAHCGTPDAERTWDMRPCAIGTQRTHLLCDACDLELNRHVLAFFHISDADALLEQYSQGPTP